MSSLYPPVTGRVMAGFSGSLDANGNAMGTKILQTQRMPQAGIVSLVAQSTASPNAIWTLFISSATSGGSYIGSAIGGSCQGGPWILMPNEMILIEVNGGTAGDSITGTVIGIQGVDPNNLPTITQSSLLTGVSVSGTIQANITGGTVGVTDSGLAGSIAQNLSQFVALTPSPVPLPAGTTTSINVGHSTSNPYPSGCASWQMVINGMNGQNLGLRVVWRKFDTAGNAIGYVQRDTSSIIVGTIIASGILDAPQMTFQVTLPAGAPAGCTATLYATALLIQDNWYDTGIYGTQTSMTGYYNVGMDGILTMVSNTMGGGGNQVYQLPTYRGPAQLGIQMSQAGHIAIRESQYTGALIGNYTNIAVSASGQAQQFLPIFLGGMNNSINTFNDNASTNNTFFMEIRAIKDLLD